VAPGAPNALPRSGSPGRDGASFVAPAAERCATPALVVPSRVRLDRKPAIVPAAVEATWSEFRDALRRWAAAGGTRSSVDSAPATEVRGEDVVSFAVLVAAAVTCRGAGGGADPVACVEVGWAVCVAVGTFVAVSAACFVLETVWATGAVTGAAAFVTGAATFVTGAAAFVTGAAAVVAGAAAVVADAVALLASAEAACCAGAVV
jgi:hypothetical protein